MSSRYYDIFEDINKYPDSIVYIAYSRRGVGKTYSALKGAYERHLPIVYIKRTIDDVDFICSSSDAFDASPYYPINRDLGTNIKPRKIRNGIGAFYDMDSDDNLPISYCIALSAIKNIKGIDLSRCELMIFDEFIPQISETRILSTEGEALLDLYETIARDRLKRGRDSMKLLLFANAENIYCPVIDELQVIDDLARLAVSNESYLYVKERQILLHHVNEIALEESEKQGGLYNVMRGTKWHAKSYGGEFSKTDFSNVSKRVLKKFTPLMRIHYREHDYYLYKKDLDYYLCSQATNKYLESIDLNRDNDVRKFYIRYCIDLQESCINGHMKFSDYSLYDLIMNYGKRFKHVL